MPPLLTPSSDNVAFNFITNHTHVSLDKFSMDIEQLKITIHSNSYLFDINKTNTLIINSLILYLKYNFYIL